MWELAGGRATGALSSGQRLRWLSQAAVPPEAAPVRYVYSCSDPTPAAALLPAPLCDPVPAEVRPSDPLGLPAGGHYGGYASSHRHFWALSGLLFDGGREGTENLFAVGTFAAAEQEKNAPPAPQMLSKRPPESHPVMLAEKLHLIVSPE